MRTCILINYYGPYCGRYLTRRENDFVSVVMTHILQNYASVRKDRVHVEVDEEVGKRLKREKRFLVTYSYWQLLLMVLMT